MQKGAPSTAKEAPFSGRGRRGSAKGGRLKRGARLTPGEFAVLRSLNDCFAMIADGVRTLGAPTWTQRWRRLRFVALLVFVLPPLALLTHLCLALDHLLFPGFKKVKIEKPIFIVGNLRTGSTFLHRLIAGDIEHVARFRTVDLFIQAIVVKKVVALLGQLDEGFGAPVQRTAQWLEERTLTGFRKIHDVRLLHSPKRTTSCCSASCAPRR